MVKSLSHLNPRRVKVQYSLDPNPTHLHPQPRNLAIARALSLSLSLRPLPLQLQRRKERKEGRKMVKTALGCEPVVGSLTSSKKKEFKVTNRVQEGKRPLYAIAFNFVDARYYNVFATVGGNRVSILLSLSLNHFPSLFFFKFFYLIDLGWEFL